MRPHRLILAIAFALLVAPSVGAAPTVPDLIKDLADDAPEVRSKACVALLDHWPDGATAVPVLLDAVADDDAGVAREARLTLERLRARGLDVFTRFLRNPDDPARGAFARSLSGVERFPSKARPTDFCILLARQTRGMGPSERRAGALLLALFPGTRDESGPIHDLLVDLVEFGEAGVREAAAVALAIRGGRSPSGTASLSGATSPALRFAAIRLHGEVKDTRSANALKRALTDKSALVRFAACEALAFAGSNAKSALPILVEMMKGEDELARTAARTLARLGHTKDLVPRLESKNTSHQIHAALALSWAGPAGKPGVPILVRWLESRLSPFGGGKVHVEVAEALGRLGSSADAAVGALERKLADRDPAIRIAAAEALCRIVGADSDLAAVIHAGFRPPPGQKVRPLEARTALRATRALGATAKELLPSLTRCLRIKGGKTWPAQGRFADKLLELGPSFGRVRRMKRLALDVIGGLGQDAAEAKNVVLWLLGKSDDAIIRYRAARALRRIG